MIFDTIHKVNEVMFDAQYEVMTAGLSVRGGLILSTLEAFQYVGMLTTTFSAGYLVGLVRFSLPIMELCLDFLSDKLIVTVGSF